MDSLDLRLLRAQFVGEAYTLRGVDPRRSILGLARKVGVSRVTVSRRLARWQVDGFWNGLVTYPNPDAFGARWRVQPLLLENARTRKRFESAIRDILEPFLTFQIGDLYGSITLDEYPADSTRRQQAFRKASGCSVMPPIVDIPFPGSELPLTPRDWRILQALRRTVEPDWTRVAQETGTTLRGLERRVHRLMGSNALFFQPLLDFRRLPVSIAWVGLLYSPQADPQEVWASVERLHPDAFRVDPPVPVDVFLPTEGRPPTGGAVTFFVTVTSGSSADQVRRNFEENPGVVDVIVGFPTRNATLARGLDARIARAAGPLPPAN